MAGWGEKFSKMTQSAVNKGKGVAEITKLNMNNNNLESEIRTVSNQIGEYVVANRLLADDEIVGQKLAQIDQLQAEIAANQERIRQLKDINVCPNCGAELSRSSRFCDKCGTQIIREEPVEEVPAAEQERICVNCGAVLDESAAFCPNCGTKCG